MHSVSFLICQCSKFLVLGNKHSWVSLYSPVNSNWIMCFKCGSFKQGGPVDFLFTVYCDCTIIVLHNSIQKTGCIHNVSQSWSVLSIPILGNSKNQYQLILTQFFVLENMCTIIFNQTWLRSRQYSFNNTTTSWVNWLVASAVVDKEQFQKISRKIKLFCLLTSNRLSLIGRHSAGSCVSYSENITQAVTCSDVGPSLASRIS